ncbi:MAG: hypothetical protein V4538_15405 [Bacteroidota bacterium]
MTTYKKIDKPKVIEHSFTSGTTGNGKMYMHRGKLKTYANRTQAENKVKELSKIGFDCFVSFKWPFIIILIETKLT